MESTNKTITILTPTYNRANLLPVLYNSLLKQTDTDFEWILVDDGSSDDTKSVVDDFVSQNKIDIRYYYQANSGKHCALNKGINAANGELLFIVDSDDYLPEDAISLILEYHKKYRDNDKICGYSFLRCYEDGTVNEGYFPREEWVTSFVEARINIGLLGDKAEVFKTDVLKKYPFPEFEGEKFLPEDVIWMRMSRDYDMVHINKCIYISEYLEGGLTKQGRSKKKESPKGMMLRSSEYIKTKNVKIFVKIKMMLLYIIYGKCANLSTGQMATGCENKFLFYVLYIPACVLAYRW